MKPSEMARALGVRIEQRPAPRIAGVRLLAEYSPDPPTIVVYDGTDFERAVAHELYHHFGGRDEAVAQAFLPVQTETRTGKNACPTP